MAEHHNIDGSETVIDPTVHWHILNYKGGVGKTKQKLKIWKLLVKGITAFSLTMVIATCRIPGTDFVLTAYANSDKTIIGLCTGGIGNPVVPNTDVYTDGWTGCYVYYGSYDGSAMKYRVLTNATTVFGGNTMLLDCDNTITDYKFDDNSNIWASSGIKSWLNGDSFYKNTSVFTVQEKAAITSSVKIIPSAMDGNGYTYSRYAPLTGEHIFILDAMEATRPSYGYTNFYDIDNGGSDNRYRQKRGTCEGWWLRSPHSSYDQYASCVHGFGYIDGYRVSEGLGVSPAFNLNLKSVIFSSLISGAEYKLTVRDANMTIAERDGSDVTRSGNVVTIPYTISGTNSGKATRVSVLITDSAYRAGTSLTTGYTYLKLAVDKWGKSGTGTFTLPKAYADKTCGKDYYAYILAETVNDGVATDYASVPASITIPKAAESSITFYTDDREYEIPFTWDMLNSPANIGLSYDSNMATFALTLSNNAEQGQNKITTALRSLGFYVDSINYYNILDYYHPAATFAYKQVTVNKEKKNFFIITVRGTSSLGDGLSDVSLSTEGAKDFAADIFNSFKLFAIEATEKGWDELDYNDNIFLVTGHSLGGAVSNYIAGSKYFTRLAPIEQRYVFNFAPAKSWLNSTNNDPNIINIINELDPVPRVGAGVFTGDHAGINDVFYPYVDGIKSIYTALTGKPLKHTVLGSYDIMGEHSTSVYLSYLLSRGDYEVTSGPSIRISVEESCLDTETLFSTLENAYIEMMGSSKQPADMTEYLPNIINTDIDNDGIDEEFLFTLSENGQEGTVEILLSNGAALSFDDIAGTDENNWQLPIDSMYPVDICATDIDNDGICEVLFKQVTGSTAGIVCQGYLCDYVDGEWTTLTFHNEDSAMIVDIELAPDGAVMLIDYGSKEGSFQYRDYSGIKYRLNGSYLQGIEQNKNIAKEYWPLEVWELDTSNYADHDFTVTDEALAQFRSALGLDGTDVSFSVGNVFCFDEQRDIYLKKITYTDLTTGYSGYIYVNKYNSIVDMSVLLNGAA